MTRLAVVLVLSAAAWIVFAGIGVLLSELIQRAVHAFGG